MQKAINCSKDQEAIALAACYQLLLQKARVRRERLARVTAVSNDESGSNNQEIQHDRSSYQH